MIKTLYPKACASPQCAEITHNKYCNKHKQYNRAARAKNTNAAGYGITWQRLRKVFLLENPLCENCKAKGIIKPATEVHHKTNIKDGGVNDYDNLQSLCKPCHSQETRRGTYRDRGGP